MMYATNGEQKHNKHVTWLNQHILLLQKAKKNLDMYLSVSLLEALRASANDIWRTTAIYIYEWT